MILFRLTAREIVETYFIIDTNRTINETDNRVLPPSLSLVFVAVWMRMYQIRRVDLITEDASVGFPDSRYTTRENRISRIACTAGSTVNVLRAARATTLGANYATVKT